MTKHVTGYLRRALGALMVAGALGVAGPAAAGDNPHDPYEGFNRAMFAVNEGLDMVLFKPIAQGYDAALPLPAQAGISSFFDNLLEIQNALNNLLQGKGGDAAIDLGRLLVNSTVGIFGLFDVASELGLEHHREDFGQTLAVWGWAESDFLFWPGLGPRTVRDTGGWVVDIYTDPTWATKYKSVATRNSLVGLRFVDLRASLLPTDKLVDEAALDKYAYVRDGYLQRRRNLIHDGRAPRLDD
jgi:phospholipid-binding lipoprotein MlaA